MPILIFFAITSFFWKKKKRKLYITLFIIDTYTTISWFYLNFSVSLTVSWPTDILGLLNGNTTSLQV